MHEVQGVIYVNLGTALTLLALAFGAWAWVVAYGVRFLKSGIADMKDDVLKDLAETKRVVSSQLNDLERHMSRELNGLQLQQAKTSEVQSAHIHQTERRLTMLETEFQYVKIHLLNKTGMRMPNDA